MANWASERLDALLRDDVQLPPVTRTLRLGALNLTVTFLRVGKAEPLIIEAEMPSQTRQIIATRAKFIRPDGELIAEASAQLFLQPQ